MIRMVVTGAAMAALVSGAAVAAPPSPRGMGVAWVVTPEEGACRATLELAGRSGGLVPVTLVSDGSILSLRFAKEDLPERAFLPIRVDRARYSNLMLRSADGRSGELVLSAESVQALRKGASLDIAWLADEPVGAPLAGSEQALTDLQVCGAQAAAEHRERQVATEQARQRAEAEARAKAVTDAQLAAARAQEAAAEAQARRLAEEAERQRRAEAEQRERAYQAERQRAYEEAEARRAYEEAQARRAYEEAARRRYEEERWAPPPPPPAYRWGYRY